MFPSGSGRLCRQRRKTGHNPGCGRGDSGTVRNQGQSRSRGTAPLAQAQIKLQRSLCPPGMTSSVRSPRTPKSFGCAEFPGIARPLRPNGMPQTPGSCAARKCGVFHGSSFRSGMRLPPRRLGRSPAMARPHGRTSTCVRQPTGSRFGSGVAGWTQPPSGPCSTVQTACLRCPAGGKSTGMRFGGGDRDRVGAIAEETGWRRPQWGRRRLATACLHSIGNACNYVK